MDNIENQIRNDIINAIKMNDIDKLQYLCKIHTKFFDDLEYTRLSCELGHINCLRLLHFNNVPWNFSCFLYKNDCDFPSRIVSVRFYSDILYKIPLCFYEITCLLFLYKHHVRLIKFQSNHICDIFLLKFAINTIEK